MLLKCFISGLKIVIHQRLLVETEDKTLRETADTGTEMLKKKRGAKTSKCTSFNFDFKL